MKKKKLDKNKRVKKVLKREYKIQRIDGLAPKHVTPPPEVYERIKKDNKLIGKARSIDSPYDKGKNCRIYPHNGYASYGECDKDFVSKELSIE